jgi:hypothetical protein
MLEIKQISFHLRVCWKARRHTSSPEIVLTGSTTITTKGVQEGKLG